MMALPQRAFVWLSMTKCASTSVEAALDPHALAVFRGDLKHTNYRLFRSRVVPVLALGGYKREDYEVVCLFREPIDWLGSWWRYRSRPILEMRPRHRKNWIGDVPFSSFVQRYLDRDPSVIGLGRQARFVADRGPGLGIDRIFRFESPEVWQDWLVARVGKPLEFERLNVSEKPAQEIDPSLRRRLEEFFAAEYDIYEHLRTDGQWAPPKGYLPAGLA
jgi:hypothetical protein